MMPTETLKEASTTEINEDEPRVMSDVSRQILGRCAMPPPEHITRLVDSIDRQQQEGKLPDEDVITVLNGFEVLPQEDDPRYDLIVNQLVIKSLRIIGRKIEV